MSLPMKSTWRSRSRSRRIVLLLDCCYAGAFERGMTARAGTGVGVESQFGGRGRAVITASSAMEYAFEGDELADARELAPSVFTSALVEGLETGEADRDQDGLVALDELYDYVYDKVRTATPNQTPGKWTFGVQGELIIAQRAQPVTVPAPLPRELQEAIDSPLAAVRGAAVQELARLLHGRHAGLALAAQLSLERLVNDDSRTVTAAAIAALGAQPQQAQPEQELSGQEPPGQGQLEPEPLAHVEHTPVPEPRAAAAIIQSKAPLGDPKAGQLGKKDRTAQEAGHSPAPTAAGLGAPSRTSNNRPLLAAGTLAVVGGVLIAIQLYLPYTQGFLGASRPADLWSGMIQAAVFACAGIFILVPHTRRLIGPGLLLGAVAIEPSGPVTNILNGRVYGDVGAGLMLDVTAGVVLTVAGCISGLALARAGDVHAGPRLPEGIFAWLVAILVRQPPFAS
jgi:hypothetical protein